MKTKCFVVQVMVGNWTEWRVCLTLKSARIVMARGTASLLGKSGDFRIVRRTEEVVK